MRELAIDCPEEGLYEDVPEGGILSWLKPMHPSYGRTVLSGIRIWVMGTVASSLATWGSGSQTTNFSCLPWLPRYPCSEEKLEYRSQRVWILLYNEYICKVQFSMSISPDCIWETGTIGTLWSHEFLALCLGTLAVVSPVIHRYKCRK